MQTALVQTGQEIQPVPKDQKTHFPPKPWIKTRLGPRDWDAKRIVDNWYVERKAAPNLAQAIRLWDAVERGDLDAVRQLAPMLVAALGRSQRTTPRSRPPLDSDSSFKDLNSGSDQKEGMRAAVCEVTCVEYSLNRSQVDRLVDGLLAASYTPDDVRRWDTQWWRLYWKGKPVEAGGRGERPTLDDVRRHIGQVKTLPPPAAIPERPPSGDPPNSAAQADPPVSPVQACDELPDEDEPFDDTPLPQPRPQIAGCWAYDRWLSIKGQLQLVIGRQFDLYFDRHRLVEYEELEDRHRFTITVPRTRDKEWIEKNSRDYVQRTLVDRCRRRRDDGSFELPKKVEVVIEVDEYL